MSLIYQVITGKNIKKHVIDNSCGDGAFLVVVVKRYCVEYLKISADLQTLSKELVKYIHGIEINATEAKNVSKI